MTTAADPPASTTAPTPRSYRHWKLQLRGRRSPRWRWTSPRTAASAPATSSSSTATTSASTSSCTTRCNRIRFEHPEVRSVIVTSAKDRVFCSGANIFMLGLSSHAWKVNFCKFTNETRNGIEDSSPPLGPQVRRRGQRRLRRRRLRAGAGLRRDRAGRRPLVVGVAARGAAARRAARHRRADARHRQAPGAPRPRRHLLHQRSKACAASARSSGGWSMRSPSRRSSRRACRSAPRKLAGAERPAGRRARAWR